MRWLLGRVTSWRSRFLRSRRRLPPPQNLEALALDLSMQLPIIAHATSPTGEVSLTGRSESGQFRLVYTPADAFGQRRAETLVEVAPERPALPASFSLFPRASSGGAREPETAVRTGDRLFDRDWILEGEPLSVLAAMSAETRAMIGRCGHLSVHGGRLYMLAEGLNTELTAARDQVQHATALARQLSEGLVREVTAARCLENLHTESNGQVRLELTMALLRDFGEAAVTDQVLEFWLAQFSSERRVQVRLQVLGLLVERVPERDGTKRLLELALRDTSPDVRLLASKHAPEGGIHVMKQVAATRFAGEETRIDALFLLGRRLPADEFREMLILCAKDAATRLRRYALRRLLDDPGLTLPEDLVRVAKGSDREAAIELGQLLAEAPAHIAEPALLQLLANRSNDVKRAAASALGDVGTVEAVPPLLALAAPIIFDGSLRDVARNSILQIQYRIREGEAGGLSLIELGEQSGALSTADAEVGALSFRPRARDDV